jgi:cytochrome o ubiquinol oxidase subunit 2
MTLLTLALFDPKGFIAMEQKDLLITAVLLMLVVVIPAFIMVFTVAWRYRAGNTQAPKVKEYKNYNLPIILWWAFPSLIILIMSVMTWQKTHELDPYIPIASENPPITIQVVALQWKWLFIYPEQDIASVNFMQVPEDTPINFVLTSDGPMNSFWIPQLGGQMYAMSGMSTKLHLIANEQGNYPGVAAEINGKGFAGMRFVARVTSKEHFDQWVNEAKASSAYLSGYEYELLAQPSENNIPVVYSGAEPGLYDSIMMKYMSHETQETKDHEAMTHN